MKRLVVSVASLVTIVGAALLAQRPGADLTTRPETAGVRLSWDRDLVTIEWPEDLADAKAVAQEVPFSLVTGPYLGWLTPSSATIGWEVVAQKDAPLNSSAGPEFKFRSAKLKDLKPDTSYRYRLVASNGKYRFESKEYAFRTLPLAQSQSFRFAVIGDTQVPSRGKTERTLFGLIRDWKPAFFLHLGDMLPTGRDEGAKGHAAWFDAQDRNRDARASLFMAPTLGNHCWKGSGPSWYADYFADVAPAGDPGNPPRPPFYYSFDVGNAHFVSLCSEVDSGSPDKPVRDLPFTANDQLRWLEKDLAGTKAAWKVVFFHKPLHTVGPYPCAESFRTSVGAVLDKYKVQVVLSGHDHSYQKTKRITNLGRQLSDTGSVQVVSGGGSGGLFDRKSNPEWNLVHQKIFHYLRVEVAPNDIRFQAVDEQGTIIDAWRLPMTGQPEAMNVQ
jgi:hypothetical protein